MLKNNNVFDFLEKNMTSGNNQNLESPITTPHGRLKSWESCYLFFKKNCTILSTPSNPNYQTTLDVAQLQLAFYLASFGMYRNQHLLNCDQTIFKETIVNLFATPKEHMYSTDYLATSSEILSLSTIIEQSLKHSFYEEKINFKPTETLTTKILMGIFACTPAYDNNFKKAIRSIAKAAEQENINVISNLSGTWNLNSHNALLKFIKNSDVRNFIEKYRPVFHNDSIKYPLMRCIDLMFWLSGENK